MAGGLVGMVCCVGPTVLALLGVVSAGTAFVWATDLYAGYRWWFRLAGLAVVAVLVWAALRRRDQCSLAGARAVRWRLLAIAVSAVVTYVVLYNVTTWCYSIEMLDRYAMHRPIAEVAVHHGLSEDEPPAVNGEDLVWMGRIEEEKAPHLAIKAAAMAGRRIKVVGPTFDRA